jgi:DNA-binding NarL/FixJ family response regulator
MQRVLVVDDDPEFAALVGAVAENEPGFQVVGYARDGAEALELVARLAPEIVLMDLEMPVLDGVVAARAISERYPRVRVVFVSGSDFAERALEAGQAAAIDYVRKSRLLHDLPEALRAAAGQ